MQSESDNDSDEVWIKLVYAYYITYPFADIQGVNQHSGNRKTI